MKGLAATATGLAAALAVALGGCSASSPAPEAERPVVSVAVDPGGLRLGPCQGDLAADFRCGRLVVPVDHEKPEGRRLRLPVAVQRGPGDAPVLLNLTGGPGQPGLSFAAHYHELMGEALEGRRLVMF